MSYEKVNGYTITPYDMNGVCCYAIRDSKVGCLIRNDKNIPLIVATESYALELAKAIPHANKLINFVIEGVK